MTEPYTPSAEEVRRALAFCRSYAIHMEKCPDDEKNTDAIDRWLTSHDAEVRKQVAEEMWAFIDEYAAAYAVPNDPYATGFMSGINTFARSLAEGGGE